VVSVVEATLLALLVPRVRRGPYLRGARITAFVAAIAMAAVARHADVEQLLAVVTALLAEKLELLHPAAGPRTRQRAT